METPVPYLCGKITPAEADTSKQKMVWSGQWGMKETDKVRREGLCTHPRPAAYCKGHLTLLWVGVGA